MTDGNLDGDFLQEFRVVSPPSYTPIDNSTIFITARPDKTTGARIVLWKEIQKAAKDVYQVRNGKILVSLVMDDNFEEVLPQRILYYPGVVLDIVIPSQEPLATVIPESSKTHSMVSAQSQTTGQANATERRPDSSTNRHDKLASITQDTNDLSTTAIDTLERRLVAQTTILESEEQRSLQRYGQLPIAQQTDDVAGMQIKGLEMDDSILDQLKGIGETGMANNDIYHMYTIRMLHQIVNRQAIIENKLQAVMQQNYELHEYPIPRLFIVLPKPKRLKDKMTHLLSKKFRLYFLCECGDLTIGAGRGNLPNKIHLAKHEGYDLDQPNEFFQRYGSYVLAVMKFVKYGVMAAGVAVPPLAMFKVVEGIETIQKSLGMTIDKIGSLVDETIKHIQEMEENAEVGGSATAGPMRLDDIEALEGADLRQLQLFLNDKDKGRILGDLFRIFTPDGHVKWVCIDHYKENYRKAAIQRLKDIIKANDGEHFQGFAKIKLGSTTVASQFYEAMVKAHGVRDLVATLEWDVTLGDLRAFSRAITNANVAGLLVNGKHFKGPVLDLFNNGHRYNPILDLMCNRRLHEMVLRDIDHFYQRIDVSSMMIATHLQKLNLFASKSKRLRPRRLDSLTFTHNEKASELSLYNRNCKPILMGILKRCPGLVEMSIGASDLNEAYEDLTGEVSILPKTVTICGGDSDVVVQVSESKIQSAGAFIKLPIVHSSTMQLLRKGDLTKLEMVVGTEDLSMTRLVDLLLWNPKIQTVILMECLLPQVAVEAITSARGQILSARGSCKLREVGIESIQEPENIFWVSLMFQDGSNSPVISASCSMLEHSKDLIISKDPFILYGWSLSTLIVSSMFDDSLASVLDKVTEERGSNIKALTLDTTTLTTVGVECMERVIDRSQEPKLMMCFSNLHEEHQLEKFERLIRRYGKILLGLTLYGESAHVWIPKVMTLCPTRTDFPVLSALALVVFGEAFSFRSFQRNAGMVSESHQVSLDCAQWIASMVSGSSQHPSALFSSLTQSNVAPMSSTCITLNPLRFVSLPEALLTSDGWNIVIKVLDFSVLEYLHVGNNFSIDNLKLLVNCIPLNTNPVRKLKIRLEINITEEDEMEWDTQIARLKAKSSEVMLRRTWQFSGDRTALGIISETRRS
ncbi:hypothetical protein BGX31_008983 [Mortierella sp. GBA43]|nr:hypothetical protein BGX31_008983 [Mortierella sp. GBA43]